MNILITGGLGYVGGRIAHYLKEQNPAAHIFLTTRKEQKGFPSWTENFTVLQMNLLDETSIAHCIEHKNIDVIIHLAALDENESMKSPALALKVNTEGTYKLLKIAHDNNVNRFIYFSTFHVYGKTAGSLITEETPTKPVHPYAITHRAAEDFISFFNHYYGMNTLIFRSSNGYGYPMHKEINQWMLVFNDLCKQAVVTGRIVLKSSGKQHRDFITLHDMARAVYHFLFAIPENWGDGLYNLGGNCSMSILEVAQTISNVYHNKYNKDILEIETKPDNNHAMRPEPVHYNTEKIKNTGFTLEGDILLEIERTMDVCEEMVE